MITWRKPGRRPAAGPAPAGERGEHRWPVATAIIAVAGLHVALPARYRVQPAWVVPVVLLVLLAVLIAGDPGRIDRQKTWLRVVTGTVIAFITVASLLARRHRAARCRGRAGDAGEAGDAGRDRLGGPLGTAVGGGQHHAGVIQRETTRQGVAGGGGRAGHPLPAVGAGFVRDGLGVRPSVICPGTNGL
jgi:hypothetical protein